MQLGLALAPRKPARSVPFAEVRAVAGEAEALGFDSLWVADGPGLDPLPVLGALGRVTSRVRLGTLALDVRRRPPAIAAKALATVDVLCGGRLTVCLSGEGVPADVLHSAFAIVAAMFAGGWGDAACRPPPLQRPRPPLWAAGRDDVVVELAARLADGWSLPGPCTQEEYRERLGVLERACERVGRDPLELHRAVVLPAVAADRRHEVDRRLAEAGPGALGPSGERGALVGDTGELAEQLAGWAVLGVATVVAVPSALPCHLSSVDDLAVLAAARP